MPTVREYAALTTAPVAPSLDRAQIPQSAFNWLAEHASGASSEQRLVKLDSPNTVRVLNFVGLIETPCGTRIEILPKHSEESAWIEDGRRLLISMVTEALRLTPRLGGQAQITRFNVPLPEWLATQFLDAASDLVRRGLRQTYQQFEAREPFLRGALDVAHQIRSGPAAAHLFSFRHDVFTFDRPENRLIRSGIERVLRATRLGENWRAARELSLLFSDVPLSGDVRSDFTRWSGERLMADYAAIKPLCEMILLSQTPFAIAGADRGLSMLFPMERLFEEYVTASLRRIAPPDLVVRPQVSENYLCRFQGQAWFPMRPDILVSRGGHQWVVDAKWKLLSSDRAQGFGIAQADLYQLFAYGQKYLDGDGELYLVYPATSTFTKPLGPFAFSETLNLYALPFDLATRQAEYGFLADPAAFERLVS
ncbi:MAG: McrC family protein [Pseudomonadota bacterium]|nr:McrC family protein [Pseudomonadota bacterium]